MEISIPVLTEIVETTGSDQIIDSTKTYNVNEPFVVNKSDELQDDGKIYQWIKEAFKAPGYSASATYKVGDIIMKGGKVTLVTASGNSVVPAQPEQYSAVDNTWTFNTWTKYFSKVMIGRKAHGFTGFTVVANGITYKLFQDPKSRTGWRYSLSWMVTGGKYWGDEVFERASNANGQAYTMVWYGTDASYNDYKHVDLGWHTPRNGTPIKHLTGQSTPIPGKTIWTGSDGHRYMCGNLKLSGVGAIGGTVTYYWKEYYDVSNKVVWINHTVPGTGFRQWWFGGKVIYTGLNAPNGYALGAIKSSTMWGIKKKLKHTNTTKITGKAFAIRREYTGSKVSTYVEDVHFYTSLDSRSSLIDAKHLDVSNPYAWMGKTWVLRGTDLYVRTSKGTAELSTTSTPVFATVNKLEMLAPYGMVYIRVTDPNAPFDGKNYTIVKGSGTITIKAMGLDKFDTVALGGIIADTIEVRFNKPDGTEVSKVLDFEPDNHRDIDRRLPDYHTNSILYATDDIAPNGSVFITLKGIYIELGSLLLGLSVNAGFTNLDFVNEFIDYSPMEKDKWGNIIYREGVKANIHSGTVDLPIQSYDMMNRLMISIGGKTVIVNGSDSKDNLEADSECIFDATMLIGRISNFKLRTRLVNKRIGDMASYTFKITENI